MKEKRQNQTSKGMKITIPGADLRKIKEREEEKKEEKNRCKKKKKKKEKQRAPPLLLFKSSQTKPRHWRWIGQHGWPCILASKHLKLEKSGRKEVHRKVQGKARQIRAFFKKRKKKKKFCYWFVFLNFSWFKSLGTRASNRNWFSFSRWFFPYQNVLWLRNNHCGCRKSWVLLILWVWVQ